MQFESWLAFCAIAIAIAIAFDATIIPGPAILLVITQCCRMLC